MAAPEAVAGWGLPAGQARPPPRRARPAGPGQRPDLRGRRHRARARQTRRRSSRSPRCRRASTPPSRSCTAAARRADRAVQATTTRAPWPPSAAAPPSWSCPGACGSPGRWRGSPGSACTCCTCSAYRNRVATLINLSWRYLAWGHGGGVIVGDEPDSRCRGGPGGHSAGRRPHRRLRVVTCAREFDCTPGVKPSACGNFVQGDLMLPAVARWPGAARRHPRSLPCRERRQRGRHGRTRTWTSAPR